MLCKPVTADVYWRDMSHYPILEGAQIFSANMVGMQGVAADNARLAGVLTAADIAIKDIPHVLPTNPEQPEHDPVLAQLVAQNLAVTQPPHAGALRWRAGHQQGEPAVRAQDQGVLSIHEPKL